MSVVRQGKYRGLHDESILRIYGNDVKVDKYGNAKEVDENWLLSAGFIKDGERFLHPKIKNRTIFDGKGLVETEEPYAFVVFEKSNARNNENIYPHIKCYDNIHSNEPSDRIVSNQEDFCDVFFEKTKLSLAIKPDCVKKAMVLNSLSAMFMDGILYKRLTESLSTNSYAAEHSGVLNGYMNRFLMDLIGFKYEGLIDEKLESIEEHHGPFNYTFSNVDALYSHEKAPGFKFSVNVMRSMCTDMYKIEDGKLLKVNGYDNNGKRVGKNDYHPFSPTGLAKMFLAETGNELDLSGLNGIYSVDIKFMSLVDLIKRMEYGDEWCKKIREALQKFDKDDRSEERKALVEELMDSREMIRGNDDAKDVLGYFNFPLVYELYSEHFKNPSKEFREASMRYLNLISSMWGINRLLMPSVHFGQHGDYEDNLEFSMIFKDVVIEKMLLHYSPEFKDKEKMLRMLSILRPGAYKRFRGKRRGTNEFNTTVYRQNGKKVAVWYNDQGYGYILTKDGR